MELYLQRSCEGKGISVYKGDVDEIGIKAGTRVRCQMFRGVTITRQSLSRLACPGKTSQYVSDFSQYWLNDEGEKVYIFSSFLHRKLLNGNKSAANMVYKVNEDLFSKNLCFIPINTGLHWTGLVVNLAEKSSSYLNKIYPSHSQMQQQRKLLRVSAYRLAAYRNFTWWSHGYLGKKRRKAIPACAVGKIRETYPEASGIYTGFNAGL
ncbi:predicted protein [Nematostella vectensis]|uniref:Ubiquitin-like protease family profile domain-containing protein n=1 Tax=Nematostella vectensis TaxID=45351 RepID=A7SU61_NEMVE|nr:predicted protein [Nematostella vectensis]|eukprot:XP_001624869.1 predicted protein [Nematostella vectensis]